MKCWVCAFVLWLSLPSLPLAAMESDFDGGNEVGISTPIDDRDGTNQQGDLPDASVGETVVVVLPGSGGGVPDFVPSVGAGRSHPVSVVESVPCGEWRYVDVDAPVEPDALDDGSDQSDGSDALDDGSDQSDGSGVSEELVVVDQSLVCVELLTCGAERVDDRYLGRISGGSESVGEYGAYLSQVASGAAGGVGGVVDVDLDGLNTSLLAFGLGDPPDGLAIATFNWCRNNAGRFERSDPVWGVSFEWGTDFDAEYDRSAILAGLRVRLRSDLDLYNPVIGAAPPVSVGHTYVKFPTWLWIEDPLESHVVSAQNADVGTIQVSLRVSLVGVEFVVGDRSVLCGVDELVAYVDGEVHPFDDVGTCHLVFDEVGVHELSALMVYEVHERVRQRRHRSQGWPDVDWVVHDEEPLVELNPSAGRYEVHKLLSLNVNEELASG